MTANNEFQLRYGGVVTYHGDDWLEHKGDDWLEHKLTFETSNDGGQAYDSVVFKANILKFYRWLGQQLLEAGVFDDSEATS